MTESDIVCWVLSDGRRGMENQCLGIAEAVAARRAVEAAPLQIQIKTIDPRAPWKWLPESLFGYPWPLPFAALGKQSDTLKEPWPDLLIACGRKTVAYAAAIRRLSGGKTLVVQTQDPRLPAKYFDLVVPPEHDALTGSNVMAILGSPNRITPETLQQGSDAFASLYQDLPRPLVAVLIGGNSTHHQLTSVIAGQITDDLGALVDQGFGLAITTSRRTGADFEAMLQARLSRPGVHIWDGTGDNPYFGMLALADHILVTSESTNMVTEAAATGKPVHVIALAGGAPKFDRFHSQMEAAGITRPFTGSLDNWTYTPLRETSRVADKILELLAARNF